MTAREIHKTTIKNNKPQPQYIRPGQQIIGGKNKPIGQQNDYGIGDPVSSISAMAILKWLRDPQWHWQEEKMKLLIRFCKTKESDQKLVEESQRWKP